MLADPLFVVAVALVVGLCVGSFLNVVIHRLPKMLERGWRAQCAELRGETAAQRRPAAYNLVVPRSACPACGQPIGALREHSGRVVARAARQVRGVQGADLGPLSARRGRSAGCWPPTRSGASALTRQGGAACVFLWMLLALTFIDFDTQLLPDNLTLPLLWAGLVANLLGLFVSLRDAVIGAIAGYLALWIVYWLFKLIRGKEGMGYGDFKLLAALGAWLGWQMLPLIILLSSVVGAVDRHLADRVQGARPQHPAGVRPVPRDRRRRRALLRSAA